MKFEKSQGDPAFPTLEESVLQHWKTHRIFERSVEEKDPKQQWFFYDGPPFATGLPHHGHLLAGTIKDVVPRYWTMRGKKVARRFGWDCHGLPVEFEIEKELKLNGRKDIEAYGIGKFNEACRSVVLRYAKDWRRTVERVGRWIDFDHDYKTMDPSFMESVWAIFKRLWDKGLVYEDKKIVRYSTRIATPLSNFEASLNYQDVQDPSVVVKFPVQGEEKTFFLVWTTTPWTLPANLALAVHPDFNYTRVRFPKTNETYYIHEKLLASAFSKNDLATLESLETVRGASLTGKRYLPLFPAFSGRIPPAAFQVLSADFVSDDSGTGIVHLAPNFGEEDFDTCKRAGIEALDHLDAEGVITSASPQFEGLYFKDADKPILQDLKTRGLLFKQETIQHSYPFCYRSNTPLIFRAISTWFVNVTKIKEQLIQNNQTIHWVPEHLRDGRFGKWLEGARDWAISRNRFWGNPIPVWRNQASGETYCVGSIEELQRLSGKPVTDLHKHFIDPITIRSPKTGAVLTRIPEVLDCWFESGSMPYAQCHFPFSTSEEKFDEFFPAEFIAEGLDQTRGWFYTLLVLSTALGKGAPFKNVIVNGIVLAEDGRKMSKSLKNYPAPDELFEKYGADALRIYLLQSAAVHGEELRFSEQGLTEMIRKFHLPLWNAYSFLATYASVDEWDPETQLTSKRTHELDRWLSVKLERLKADIETHMEAYHLARTVPPLLQFLDDLTNWYIRRSRRRFWKSENDQDKNEAYSTLYSALLDMTKLIAPFTPFLAETLFQRLSPQSQKEPNTSVHLENIPRPRALSEEETTLEKRMDACRSTVALGRELREKLKIKVRQPLGVLHIGYVQEAEKKDLQTMSAIIQEELNVKLLSFLPFKDMATWTIKPNFKTLGQRLGPKLKELQKELTGIREKDVFSLLSGKSLSLAGETLYAHDLLIELKPAPGFAHPSQSLGSCIVALETELTEELLEEGLAREFINRVQRSRKEKDFNVDDRIKIDVDGDLKAVGALRTFRKLVEEETLSKLEFQKPSSGIETDLNGLQIQYSLHQV